MLSPTKSSRIIYRIRLLFIWGITLDLISKGELKSMNDKELRKKVKLLKATDSIKSYTELAEMLEMSRDSFYNWLKGYYDFGAAKK